MSKPKDRLITVEIHGQRYALRGSDDPAYVEKLARHVDQKMREISDLTPTVDSLKAAVLAAVNIADEYFQLRAEQENVEGIIRARAEQIGALLDEAAKR